MRLSHRPNPPPSRCPSRRPSRRRSRRENRGDGGFAAAELIVVTMLAAIVFAAVAGSMASGQDRELDLEDVAASQEGLQATMGTLLKDVRAAEPLWFETSTPEDQLGMQRVDPETGATVNVRWRIETAANNRTALVRETVQLDPVTGLAVSATATHRLDGLDTSIPPFAYFTKNGTQVSGATLGPYTECTSRVMVTLRAAPLRGQRPLTLISQAELRNGSGTPWWCP